jgi:polar amino acid transport system substrate-binding protein
VRAAEIVFTAPYVLIEGTYTVRQDSALRNVEDVDRPGIRIAVGLASAYDLFLTRSVKNAMVLHAPVGGGRVMIEMFVNDRLDVAAGVRQQLDAFAKTDSGMRVMPGHFQEIMQAMGMPRVDGQPRAAYLAAFVEEMKSSGFVAEALRRSGQVAEVAPPAPR